MPNISSNSTELNGLCAALTNPTEISLRKGHIYCHYPVTYGDYIYEDAESAYQGEKKHSETSMTFLALQDLMTDIITAKLQQHPRLRATISHLGGTAWLETCSHIVNRGRWEGIGPSSPFISCLIAAYARCRNS